MKNKIKILYAVVSVLTFIGISSCNNDEFLTVDHYSILPADQMFKSDEDAKAGLVGCYDLMLPSGDVDGDGNIDYNGDWGFKPNLFVGGHPTMDTQATGWDKDFMTQMRTIYSLVTITKNIILCVAFFATEKIETQEDILHIPSELDLDSFNPKTTLN